MTPAIALANIVSASEQAAVIVVLAALLVWLLRLDTPGVRYVFWRVVALGCLLLPWVQRYRPTQASIVTTEIASGATRASGLIAPASRSATDLTILMLLLVTAGAVLRLLWLLTGVVKLRHLRPIGPAESPSEVEAELQRTLGTRADVRYSPNVTQPVTFGVLNPVVLLPESLSVRRATFNARSSGTSSFTSAAATGPGSWSRSSW
jgi:beta-lactamase regulating signal transducer with metallopeptidase domain